jgi:hypothetical protein
LLQNSGTENMPKEEVIQSGHCLKLVFLSPQQASSFTLFAFTLFSVILLGRGIGDHQEVHKRARPSASKSCFGFATTFDGQRI